MDYRKIIILALATATIFNIAGCSSSHHSKITHFDSSHYSKRPVKVDSNHYVVQKGDTLFSIAFANGIDHRTLALINNIDVNRGIIHPGDVLLIRIKNLNASNVYRVKSGDTLYSIARRHKTTVKKLAQINRISAPYSINVGQLLVINPKKPMFVSAKVTSRPKDKESPPKKTTTVNKPEPQKTEMVTSRKSQYNSQSKLSWQWPAQGAIVANTTAGNIIGINIAGKKGQDVRAASSGKIVYAGNALRGYGNLIIIKHNDDYLSAYAHNDQIMVKELQSVRGGQVIAKMGDTDSNRVNLHFEIRFRGQAVNPRNYLPKR